jgi:hypothetical protein
MSAKMVYLIATAVTLGHAMTFGARADEQYTHHVCIGQFAGRECPGAFTFGCDWPRDHRNYMQEIADRVCRTTMGDYDEWDWIDYNSYNGNECGYASVGVVCIKKSGRR